METTLEGLNGKVPTEVWGAIFKITQEMEYDDYTKHEAKGPLRPMVYIVSSVCRHWRWIVYDEHPLWSLVPAPFTNTLTQGEDGLLSAAITKSNVPVTLVVNVSQTLKRDYNRRIRYDMEGVMTTEPKIITVFGRQSYNIHVKMQDSDPEYMSRIQWLPFCKADTVTISAAKPLCCDRILKYFQNSPPQSITIINDYPIAQPFPEFARFTTKSLTLRVNLFSPRAVLESYFIPSLEELYIFHTSRRGFPKFTGGIQLPNLHTLGITPAAATILEHAEMPNIRTLILYGSVNPDDHVQVSSGANADQTYQRLGHIEFREWGTMDGSKPNSGAVSLLWRMGPKLKALESIKFTDSFIDGAALVKVVADFIQRGSDGSGRYLKEMTLNRVSGITRDECDLVKTLVPKMIVYV